MSRQLLINAAVRDAAAWLDPAGIDYGSTTLPKYQTQLQLVQDVLRITPFKLGESVLDVGAGDPAVFYNELSNYPVIRHECEIQRGVDFFTLTNPFDWCIGNPPFERRWPVVEHAARISTVGFAFLYNNHGINALTPRRRQWLSELGWYQYHEYICCDKRWFGRYYWVIFTRQPNNHISWRTGSY